MTLTVMKDESALIETTRAGLLVQQHGLMQQLLSDAWLMAMNAPCHPDLSRRK